MGDQTTPLHAWHAAHGARLVPFGGWSMPVQYATGILAEHRAVRASAGLFDISHMGRVLVRGPDALALLQHTTTNDVTALAPGRAQYTLLCNPRGGILDDLIIYRLADPTDWTDLTDQPRGRPTAAGEAAAEAPTYLAVVNAGRRPADLAWWREYIARRGLAAELHDCTTTVAMIALQGPRAEALLQPLADLPLASLRYYAARRGRVAQWPALFARTGYTGEDGFELMVASDAAVALWETLLGVPAPEPPLPCGLGARDTLRLEAGMALYGNELTDEGTPLEAGLGRFVKLDKPGVTPAAGAAASAGDEPFVGAGALAARQRAGLSRQLVGFEMVDSAIPRHGYAVVALAPTAAGAGATETVADVAAGTVVGAVTSGNLGPSVGRQIGMAYVPPALAAVGSEFGVVVRERVARARVVPLPFWKHRTRRFAAAGGS